MRPQLQMNFHQSALALAAPVAVRYRFELATLKIDSVLFKEIS
jgi:hypothetical protein